MAKSAKTIGPLVLLACACLVVAAPADATSITVLDAFNPPAASPAAPFTLASLGSTATTPTDGYVGDGTIVLTGETITFGAGVSQTACPSTTPGTCPSGEYVSTTGGVAQSPLDDTTSNYLVAQPNTSTTSGVTITFGAAQTTFDLLWGSIDVGASCAAGGNEPATANDLYFYSGMTQVAEVTGCQVEGALATDEPSFTFSGGETNAYVELTSLPSFTSVVAVEPDADSAFEFIPGAVTSTPEPSTLLMLGAGLAGLILLGGLRRRRAIGC